MSSVAAPQIAPKVATKHHRPFRHPPPHSANKDDQRRCALKREQTKFMLNLLEDQTYSDTSIEALHSNATTVFHLHKAILEFRCPQLLDCKVVEVPPETFKNVLNFVYGNIVPPKNLKQDQVLQILYFTNSVSFDLLERLCSRWLVSHVDDKNAYDLLIQILSEKPECKHTINNLIKNIILKKIKPSLDHTQSLVKHPQVLTDILTLSFSHKSLTWTENIPSLGKLMHNLQSASSYYDCEIIANDKTIPAHKFILATKWPFFNDYLLKNTPFNTKIPSPTLEKVIQFFYFGKVDPLKLSLRDCAWIQSLGEKEFCLNRRKGYPKYGVPLYDYCQRKMKENITSDNWLEMLQVGCDLNDNRIIQRSKSAVPDNITKDQWLEMLMKLMMENTNHHEKQIIFQSSKQNQRER
eukprot:TRINITY_DN805_c0_g2_i2.p1 TRINITY_DN805_c0_g2~~TRINITY_DN805_c0_g2_i2.p1  ORF type:complete len:409 (+),score=112.88 TRINITY_DN805_c0_g2_i2:3-1229(+)